MGLHTPARSPVRVALPLRWIWRSRMAAAFAGADLLLAAAQLLNECGLLSPAGIGGFFGGAERLTRAGMNACISGATSAGSGTFKASHLHQTDTAATPVHRG